MKCGDGGGQYNFVVQCTGCGWYWFKLVFFYTFSLYFIAFFCCCCWTSINISTRIKFRYFFSTISQYQKKQIFFFLFNFKFVSFKTENYDFIFSTQEHRVQASTISVLFLCYILNNFRFKLKLIEIHLSHISTTRMKHITRRQKKTPSALEHTAYYININF